MAEASTVQRLTGGGATHSLTQTSYDALGRPECSATRMNPPGQVVGRTTSHQAVPFNEHANVNRSDSVNGLNQISQSGSTNVTHDARGNMTSDGTRTFGYRSDNAMTSASGGVTLSYDPLGRLSEISSPSGTPAGPRWPQPDPGVRFRIDGGGLCPRGADRRAAGRI